MTSTTGPAGAPHSRPVDPPVTTSDLIDALGKDPAPVRPRLALPSLALALAAGLAACGALVWMSGRIRPDLPEAMIPVAAKAAFSLMLVLAAIPAMLWLARPGRRAGLWLGVGVAIACLAVVAGAVAIMAGEGGLAAAMGAGGRPVVFVVIPLLALPAGAVLFLWCRSFAPTRLALAGAAAGALAGGLAAAAYTLVCPVDQPMFIATWYTASVVFCGAIGAALGRIFLRW